MVEKTKIEVALEQAAERIIGAVADSFAETAAASASGAASGTAQGTTGAQGTGGDHPANPARPLKAQRVKSRPRTM